MASGLAGEGTGLNSRVALGLKMAMGKLSSVNDLYSVLVTFLPRH